MTTIKDVIAELFDRGNLPAMIQVRAAFGPARAGDVASWDPEVRGYRLQRSRDWILMAGRVRELWGEYFLEHHEEMQPCLAL